MSAEKQYFLSREFWDFCIYRIIYYGSYAALACSTFYLPLFLKQLGLDAAKVGVLMGVRPFLQGFGSPIGGALSDRYKIRKIIAVIALIAFTAKHLGILLVQRPNQICITTHTNSTNMLSNETKNNATILNSIRVNDIGGKSLPNAFEKRKFENAGVEGHKFPTDISEKQKKFKNKMEDYKISDKITKLLGNNELGKRKFQKNNFENETILSAFRTGFNSIKLLNEDHREYKPERMSKAWTKRTSRHHSNKKQVNEFKPSQLNKQHYLLGKRDEGSNQNFTRQSSDIITSDIITKEAEKGIYFIYLLIIIVVFELIGSPLNPLLDASVVDLLGEKRNDFGKYRLWGSVGMSSAALLVGAITQGSIYNYCNVQRKNYNYMFLCLFGFSGLTLVPLIFSKQVYSTLSSSDQPAQSGLSKLKALFSSVKNISFWMTILGLAMLDGFQMDFGPWFLDDLGTSSAVIGMAVAAHFAVNTVTFILSPYVINRLGCMTILSLCLSVNIVMFVLFSVVKSSWSAVVLYSLAGFVPSMSWTCGVAYVAMVSTPLGVVSTGQGKQF